MYIRSTIIGPYDNLITSTLTISPFPTWARERSHTHICVWDAAAAHMNHEDALRKASPEAGGQAFLVTGKTKSPWRVEDIRAAIKVCIFIVHDTLIYIFTYFLAAPCVKADQNRLDRPTVYIRSLPSIRNVLVIALSFPQDRLPLTETKDRTKMVGAGGVHATGDAGTDPLRSRHR
jgi:hypothetical protein